LRREALYAALTVLVVPVAIAMGTGAAHANTTPAAAAAAASCPKHTVCFWANANYKGTPWTVRANGNAHPAPASFRNRASSLIVGQGAAVTMYNDPDCTFDPSISFRSGARIANLDGWAAYDDIMDCVVA
jgi:Peptidase inhibitor family I36